MKREVRWNNLVSSYITALPYYQINYTISTSNRFSRPKIDHTLLIIYYYIYYNIIYYNNLLDNKPISI